ncbi:MAG: TetR/AcrR family transcriptional regulator [Firmicutes bacterium]|nr:TetR/AcrR family transcriptional regulator [Bacillota bacterium]
MPKETFWNLPQAKQEEIINAIIQEFAENPFETASISRVVSKLGIAKGSMYQYFENKRAIYFYIIELVYSVKKEFLVDVFERGDDFFTTLANYYQKSFQFSLQYPLYHRVINNFWDSKDQSLRQYILDNKELRASDFQEHLENAIKQGIVRPDICMEAAFFVYHSVGKELIDSFQHLTGEQVEEHLRFINNVLNILKDGLMLKGKGEDQG